MTKTKSTMTAEPAAVKKAPAVKSGVRDNIAGLTQAFEHMLVAAYQANPTAVEALLERPVDEVVSEVADVLIDDTAVIDQQVGVFWASAAVQARLGVSRQRVSAKVKSRQILRVTTSDGVSLYPEFQFAGSAVVPGFGEALRALGDGGTAWMIALWFTNPEPALDGVTPIAALKAGRVDEVVALSRDVGERWAQ